jgi:hypothetical protein
VAARPAASIQGGKNEERIIPLGIFSIPTTSTVSASPERMADAARARAAPPEAQPASTSTMGTPVSPREASTRWPAATPP